MMRNLKKFISLGIIDKNISDGKYEPALLKLNQLIENGMKDEDTLLKRGQLCHKLFLLEDAYSDFSYIIKHYDKKSDAYYERMIINFETENYWEAVIDATRVLMYKPDNFEAMRMKILSLIYTEQDAVSFGNEIFDGNKYKIIQFLLNESAKYIAENEFAKGLKVLGVIDTVDVNNPIKLYNEANIYQILGDSTKHDSLIQKLESIFPNYFISHFNCNDMYYEHNLLEICFLLELKCFDKQSLFEYQFAILEGYKNYVEGHILDSKENFERAVKINPDKADGYVLLAQTLQILSGYNNSDYKKDAEENYKIAMKIYERENVPSKVDAMKKQIKHLTSSINF